MRRGVISPPTCDVVQVDGEVALPNVVLIVTRDNTLLLNCTTALHELGFEVVTAYSPVTAEYRLRRHNVRAVVFDARILGPVSQEKPGPIFPASARVPFVFTNASALGASRRALAASYGARFVEGGTDTEGLIGVVAATLSELRELGLTETQHGEGRRIILLDDDSRFRRWVARALRGDGHFVSEYRSPSEVPPPSFREASIVITDHRMGGEDGLTFADKFHATSPTVPVLIITDRWDHEFVSAQTSRDFLYCLRKPLDCSVLLRVVRDLARLPRRLQSYNPGRGSNEVANHSTRVFMAAGGRLGADPAVGLSGQSRLRAGKEAQGARHYGWGSPAGLSNHHPLPC